ncbi:MAG: GPP34 family phosphoprotein [Evtepia sp.]
MRDLTLSQEYLICAVNEKGTLFTFNTEKLVCLVAAALLELQLEGCAAVDKKFITVTGPLPQEMAHLRPLYDYLNTGKPMQTEKLLEEYTYSVTDAHLNELMAAIGDSLVQQGADDPGEGLPLGRSRATSHPGGHQRRGAPYPRSCWRRGGHRDVAALVILLEQGKCLKPYFSAFEQKEMRDKLQAISQTPAGKAVRDMVEYVENLIAVMTLLVTVFT